MYRVYICLIWIFLCASCTSTNAQTYHTSVENYYGANLTSFPPKIRTWIVEQAFPKQQMQKKWMKNSKLKVWWSEDNNAVLFEASYTIAQGYQGAGLRKTWGEKTRYSGPDLWRYGKHKKYHTLRYRYQLKQEVDRLIQSDPAYAEVAILAKYLSLEMEYDWAKYRAYKGATPIKTPHKQYEVCVGYSKAVVEQGLSLTSVASVEEWVSKEHIWNVLNLVDGRKLYLDLTWFDNESIDEETGKIEKTDDYNWSNLTYDPTLFKYSNISYSGVYDHAHGSLRKVYKK